jgi:uncharacterized RDD family membrane protein YckC
MQDIIDAPVEAEHNFTYAGFWIRVAANIIDSFVIWIFQFLVSLVVGEIPISVGVFALVVWLIYYPAMESSSRQATLGKMAVGIKVGDANGGQLSFANALGRYFAKILSALTLYIGFMMAGWDPKCQALHDKIANTYVFHA